MRFAARLSLLSAALALGACALPDFESFRGPDTDSWFRARSVTNIKEKVLGPVAPEDLVDPNGRCAGAYIPAGGADQAGADGQAEVSLQQAGVPLIPTAIALDMSECDVVKRAGAPERVEIGAGERNERTVTLTYINGQRPGIYHFAEGRLKSMERAPEPVAPPKPAKKPAKPAKPAIRPAQASIR